MSKKNIDVRKRRILQVLIEQYIKRFMPVSSRTISRIMGNISPATIRNEMSEMEEMGYLSQPHPSAGRVPTDMGFRIYVDQLLPLKELDLHKKEKIIVSFQNTPRDPVFLMRDTTRILSIFARFPAVVISPRYENIVFKGIEFLRFDPKQVLIVFISGNEVVNSTLVQLEEDISQESLNRLSVYLGRKLKGRSLLEVRNQIVEEIERELSLYRVLLSKTLEMSKSMILTLSEQEIFIEGQTLILDQPEFSDIGRMKSLFKAFEEKTFLVKLLDKAMQKKGIQVLIGSETHLKEMHGCTFVTAPYLFHNKYKGIVGVIGPTRMNYASIIPLVDYTARVMSNHMTFG